MSAGHLETAALEKLEADPMLSYDEWLAVTAELVRRRAAAPTVAKIERPSGAAVVGFLIAIVVFLVTAVFGALVSFALGGPILGFILLGFLLMGDFLMAALVFVTVRWLIGRAFKPRLRGRHGYPDAVKTM